MINKFLRLVLILGFLFFVFTLPAFADLEILGFYENNLVGVFTRTGEAIAGDLNRMRLRVDSRLTENISLHLEPEYNIENVRALCDFVKDPK